MDAYSMPITPVPATTIERGTVSRWWIPSESMTVRSSNSTLAGRAGWVPVAITTLSAVARRTRPSPASTSTVCGSRKRPVPVMRRDPVTGELAAHHVHLPADHVGGACGQGGDGDVVLDPVALPVHLPLVQRRSGRGSPRAASGRDRARVQAHAADHVLALDDRHPALELGRGDGGLLAAGPRADNQHVVVVHVIQCDDLSPPFEPLGPGQLTKAATAWPRAASAGRARPGCPTGPRPGSAGRRRRRRSRCGTGRPCSRSAATAASRSWTSIEKRFQPPGSGSVPSGIACPPPRPAARRAEHEAQVAPGAAWRTSAPGASPPRSRGAGSRRRSPRRRR